jgi:putative flippase GtrA
MAKQFTIPSLTLQAMKFGVVGGGATFVHVLAALTYNGLAGVTPLWANFFAFLTAAIVSYAGNWFWTFNGVSRHFHAFPRFALLALTCFALNQLIVFGVVQLLGQPLWLAMVPVVIIIPVLGFWLNKTQVFLPSHSGP